MAKIVFAVGSSHGPSIQNPVETWAKLGGRDTRDPRFDYDTLLKAAKPGLDREITLDVQQAKHGVALRRAVESSPLYLRVGLIASGGLSHQIIDEELDRSVIDALIAGDVARL